MPANLNPADIAAWMRQRGRRFIEMAEEIEQTFKVNGHAQPPTGDETNGAKSSIRQLLSDGKSRRTGQIAQDLRLAEETVRAIIDATDSEFTCNERGWVTHNPDGGDSDD